ncbi:MAG: fasciclin domain-containing protein [Brevundimonas sp.]|uniref:fasciclin domain-containing protein n=1 Tax=Brevundimonas sp. TaxID=1871086 RepID=UPI0027326AE5|nr:fasciclin domain-containing protein [Brevundimonas sp.]MDP3406496.1 fasciclin domain-containing protein [Brevundimonas sp.]
MLRTRLLSAAAAVSLLAAGTAFAQTAPIPHGSAQTTTGQTVMPSAAPDSSPPRAGGQPDSPAPIAASGTTGAQGEVSGADTPAASGTVVDVLRSNGQFATLLSALDAAQLTETLTTESAISIFAPTDAAFAALPEAERTRLLDPANVNELRQLLLYHVIVADVNSSQIEGALGGVETAASVQVQLDGTGDAIKVDNATVTTADIDASNGTVFIIDRVLNPETSLVASGDAEETSVPLAADSATPGAATPDTTAPKPQS